MIVFFAQSGKTETFRAEDQQAVEAYVLHRLASFLLYSDQMNPGAICSQFNRDWRNPGAPGPGSVAKKWIVLRGREKWESGEPIAASVRQLEFNADNIYSGVRRTTVTGSLEPRTLGAQSVPMAFELELEREGWRIRKLVISEENNERVIFEY